MIKKILPNTKHSRIVNSDNLVWECFGEIHKWVWFHLNLKNPENNKVKVTFSKNKVIFESYKEQESERK